MPKLSLTNIYQTNQHGNEPVSVHSEIGLAYTCSVINFQEKE